MNRRLIALGAVAVATALVAIATYSSLALLPDTLNPPPGGVTRAEVVDRYGEPLAITYENAFNVHDRIPLEEVPPLLRRALILSEDARFFEHSGVDWRARAAALVQNLRAGRAVRGASTISEQVARMLTPRRRTIGARWLEGFESRRLEQRFGKAAVLEFYLNQVPYGERRRGVVQAARGYFDRDLSTLSAKEMLALVVIVRSPARFDPREPSPHLEQAIARLGDRLLEHGWIDPREHAELARVPLETSPSGLTVSAPHFVRHVREVSQRSAAVLHTTLDAVLQSRVQALLENQIARLGARDVSDGAAIVVDHRSDEVLAWVNAGDYSADSEGSQIDAVLAARQPGSTLKPFLYALALDHGYTAASLLEDAPLTEPLGPGLHAYRNYSRTFQGPVRLREALGNSLNIPAVRVAHDLTPEALQRTLHALGLRSLDRPADFYGEGLALGNGEVTLYELIGAYAALARGGTWRPLHVTLDPPRHRAEPARRVFSAEAASLVADILSDPEARRIEFGTGGVLELPWPTAVKTGTSTAHRDAWAIGFNDHHTVGVWLGNLDRREMNAVSGASGPALVLRGIFAELARNAEPGPLAVSRTLRRAPICRASGLAPGPHCPSIEEWFRPEELPLSPCALHAQPATAVEARRDRSPIVELVQPTPGLHLALDPRIPDELEAFALEISSDHAPDRVEWIVDGAIVATTPRGERRLPWRPVRGTHTMRARAMFDAAPAVVETAEIVFVVK